MDDLDLSILQQVTHPMSLQWNVRLSHAEVARSLKVDEETVRTRLRRLEDEGIIRGWQVVVHPAIFGRVWVRYDLPPVPKESAGKVEAALVAMDGAHLFFESYGACFALVCYQAPGAGIERQAALIEAIVGSRVHSTPLNLPPPTTTLSALDWRIVHGIRDSPRAPYAELAERLGASERTLRRHVDRLTDGRALVLNAEVDYPRITGSIFSTIHVALQHESARRPALDVLSGVPHVLFRHLDAPRMRLTWAAPSLAAAEAVRRRVEAAVGGQAHVSMELLLRRTTLRGWLDAEIAARSG